MLIIKTALLAVSISLALLQAGTGYKLETRYPVPGNGGFDYVTIDSNARRLYLSHGTQVDVIDPDNGYVYFSHAVSNAVQRVNYNTAGQTPSTIESENEL